MRKLYVLLTLSIISATLFGQTEPELIIKQFFDTYSTNQPDKALDDLYSHSPWIDINSDDVINLKTQFRDLKQLVGEFYGYQLLTKSSLGDCFELYVYMAKFDRQPFRFQFEFYKPKDKWIIYSFSYNYDLDEDLENAAKNKLSK